MKRDNLPLAFQGELIIDNFAGGGGTSTGLEAAFGRPVDIAINHDPEALAMHALNHPYTTHLCESVWDVDPIKVTGNQPVGLVWLSPDCKHFSKAKGGTPVSRDIRGLAWVGVRWALLCHPRAIALENVEEFKTWGPLRELPDGTLRPDPERKGETFEAFCGMLSTGVRPDHPALFEACEFLGIDPTGAMAQRLVDGLGYDIDCRELRACDHDTPTIRKRLFFVGRRDGLPIVWPEPTTADPAKITAAMAGKLKPWRTAAECIDFGIEARSIFDRPRPLAMNTLRRVAKGAWRYVLANPHPFIVGVGGSMGQSPTRTVNRPVQTITTRADSCVAQPVLAPVITPLRGTQESHLQGDSVGAPASTISAGGTHHALSGVEIAHIQRDMGRSVGHPADAPLGTVMAGGGGKSACVRAHLITIGYGERLGQNARAQEVRAPLGTVVAANKHAIVAACLEQANSGFYDGDGRPLPAPASTITTTGAQQRLISAYFVKYYGEGGQWSGADEPMHTLTTRDRVGLVQTVQMPADVLAPELRDKARECAEFFHDYLPEHFPEPAEMIILGGWVLVDITLRMLVPRELYLAQGFPASYQIEEIPDPKVLFVNGHQVDGDPRLLPRIKLSKTAQIRMCGNSVCPPVAQALIEANFRHELAFPEWQRRLA